MASFEDSIARMKALYTYGKDLNENKTINSYTIEHKATAADGKTYGIIRECNKYYIKVAQTGKETLAEGYNYLGGFCNKSNYEYDSYNKALKNFELKLSSINEAYDGNVNISTLDPFKKGDFIVEGTEKMQNEIARQRQIMFNVSMLMNEATEIGASRKDDVVMFDGKNPEAETGKKGDEELKETNANPEYKGSKTNGVDKKVGPFDNEPGKCEDQLKESCDCGDSNCTCDWGSKGLPSTPGVGEADNDHNNAPFTETVNESEEFDVEDEESDDIEFGADDVEGEADVEDIDIESDEEPEIGDFDDEETDIEDIDIESEESDSDIMTRIAELEAELEALKAQIDGEEEIDSEEEIETEFPKGDDFSDVEDEEMSDFENEFNDVDDSEFEDEYEDEESIEECGDMNLMEVKKSFINKIVESVTNEVINETELHDFGKHPGYQKKPMNLPTTGEDKNQWGEDWNDESVYSEEPFGSKIGDSAPYNMLVDVVTKDVMATLSGEAFKKKMK